MYREIYFIAYENCINSYSIGIKEQLSKYQQYNKHYNKTPHSQGLGKPRLDAKILECWPPGPNKSHSQEHPTMRIIGVSYLQRLQLSLMKFSVFIQR